MRQFGQVAVGSKEWTLQNAPGQRLQVSRSALNMIQAENALLHDVLRAARMVADIRVWSGDKIADLRHALALYDGWTEDPDVRMELVEKLQAIVDDLDDGGHDASP